MNLSPALAFDRQSVRETDVDGRLHVSVTNISKANICPYLGREIPGWEQLGLQSDKIYKLFRDPDELAQAADTFNNLPILDRHVAVDAWNPDSHKPEVVIGSTGTDAAFVPPYLQNSAVLWSRLAINDVQAADRNAKRGRRQWSCAYRYTPDMTPGNFEGLQYDGVMRNIIGNHVALVDEGRAGPDVLIGDCSMLKSRKALLLSGALIGFCRPKLAQDAKLDFEPLLKDLTAANLGERKGHLSVAIAAAVTPLLAADTALDIEEIVDILDAVDASGETNDIDIIGDAAPSAPGIKPPAKDKAKEFLAGKLSAEDMATYDAMCDPDAMDTSPDDKDDKAMDIRTVNKMITVAVDKARTETQAATLAEAAAIRQAERDVEPHIGAIAVAQDSADAVYKLALDAAKIDLTGVEPSAYRHMVALLPKPGETSTPAPARLAADRAAGATDFREMFPEAGKMARV